MEFSEDIEEKSEKKKKSKLIWISVGILLVLFLIFALPRINFPGTSTSNQENSNDYFYEITLEPGEEKSIPTKRKNFDYNDPGHIECFELKTGASDWFQCGGYITHPVGQYTFFRLKKKCSHSNKTIKVWNVE